MGFNSAEEVVKGIQTPGAQVVHLAEVTSLDSGKRAKIRFYGEDTESGKSYTYIDGYIPTAGDKVLLIEQGNTYIIIGAVKDCEVVVKYALKDHTHDQYAIATEVATKNHNHDSTYAAKSHAHSDYAASGHTHSDYAASNHNHSAIYGTNRSLAFSANVLIPDVNNALDLGTSSRQFRSFYSQSIYLNGSAISTSDKRKKKFIKNLSEKYIELFKKLRPVTYKYKNGTSGRTHTGFIAQEVEQAMTECGITSEEFGGLVIQENREYGLRYEEFIAMQTAVIQDLQKRIEELERRMQHGNV